MKIGFSTACMHGQCETEKALEIISELGVSCAEAALTTFYEYRPEFAKKFAERAGETQICAVSVSPFNYERQLFNSSRRVRGDGYYWLDQVLRSAQLFGCRNYVFQGADNRLSEDSWGYSRDISDFCSRYGISLCVRNSANGIFAKPEDFAVLKQNCPALCGALDISGALCSGYGLSEYLKHMAGAIKFVYLSDNVKKEYQAFLSAISGAGFEGTVIVNVRGGNISELKGFLNEIAI